MAYTLRERKAGLNMNTLEHELTYPWQEALPPLGSSLAVHNTIRWLRMPLPFALDHINLWLVRDAVDQTHGWAIVDCGIANDQTRALWEQVLATQLEGLPVLRVIATHMHPDHIGLADWLTSKLKVPLHVSMTDYFMARSNITATAGSGGESAAQHFMRHGLSAAEDLEKIRQRGDYYSNLVPALPPTYRRLMDGQLLQLGDVQWRCIAGYGHAPEHIALYCESAGVLISGDMVLPRISTNVSVWDTEPEANPLQLFLDSLSRYEALPQDTLVLPSHGKPFKGLHQRIAQLRQHHQARLVEVMQACASGPKTAAQIVPVLFKRQLDLHQMTFAMGEALAHLHMLWHAGTLKRVQQDQVMLFTVA
jgi:glyoxylase-like metal-dependent hydrolase (beta-lactamase superfamily II)